MRTPDDLAAATIRRQFADAARQLQAAAARDEALAEYVPARKVLMITKKAALVPVSRVWRLGVLLLGTGSTDADTVSVWTTGATTRALEPGRTAFQSVSAETRRDYRAAAFRGPFERGSTVNFDATPVDLSPGSLLSHSGPLFLRDSRAWIRWSPTAGDDAATEFGAYLADRVALLLAPPGGV